VNIETGAVVVLRRSTPSTPFYRPRVAPDGQSVIFSVQHEGRWRIATVPLEPVAADGDAAVTFVDPDDDANRYDADYLPGGRRIVNVSDAGGVPNVETIDLDTRLPTPVTRVAGAVFAPAPNPADTSVFFLALHARGYDLRRISLSAQPPRGTVALAAALTPAVPVPAQRVDTFPRAVPPQPSRYGAGPHQHRLLPGGSFAQEGAYASLMLLGLDPVGRFAYALNGAFGERPTWRGAAITASWRGTPSVVPGTMSIDGTLFHAEQRPSEQRAFHGGEPPFGTSLDATFTGATISTATTRDYGLAALRVRIGGNLGTVDRAEFDRAVRGLAFGEARGALRVRRGGYRADLSLGVHASRGATDGLGWARAIGSLGADISTPFGGGRLDATVAGSDGGGGTIERFAIGGTTTPLVDAPVLSQRIAMPALPVGFALGTHVKTLRASTALGPLRPYYWIGTTRENMTGWARVAGVEAEYAIPTIPAFAIPLVTIRAGAAYSWDEPFRHRVGVYAGVSYRP
jgi:hypothetical protein